MGAFVGMPCLTHLMPNWASPPGRLGERYAELGTALVNMPRLELLTAQYYGMDVDFFSLEHVHQL